MLCSGLQYLKKIFSHYTIIIIIIIIIIIVIIIIIIYFSCFST